MSQSLLEKYETLVIEMGNVYLDNMEKELGKKYNDPGHEMNAGLTDAQFTEFKTRNNISHTEFSQLYDEFLDMKPTEHLNMVMGAFTNSGGNIDIDPEYDEDSQRLKVAVNYVINDRVLEQIEGLSPIENVFVKMNAMIQVESVLADSKPDDAPAF